MDDDSDHVPLITAEYNTKPGSSPKISAFYDELENRDEPDREPSMISMDTSSMVAGNSSLSQPTNSEFCFMAFYGLFNKY